MSVYLCAPIHIAMLTRCMTNRQLLTDIKAVYGWYDDRSIDVVATDLAQKNWQSVVHRYGDDAYADQYKTCADYVDAVLDCLRSLSDAIVNIPLSRQTGMLSCYEYQACEAPLWTESAAHKHCQKLRRVLYNEMAEELARRSKRPTGWEYIGVEYSDDLASGYRVV